VITERFIILYAMKPQKKSWKFFTIISARRSKTMTSHKIFSVRNINQIDLNEGMIIDVRTQMEHAEKRLTIDHTLTTLDELNPTDFMMRHGLDKDFALYILCRSGARASQAAEKFIAEGYKNIHVIEGGIIACEDFGHEIKGHATNNNMQQNSKLPISLERQVRIAAGLFVTLGAFLALTASPLFSFIPLMIGAGLIFAGIAARCGLALLLTKAPWNKKINNSVCTTTTCAIPTKNNSAHPPKTGQSCQ
jgi:rhodanese-related sulfurtransferase